jgi:hypothetical protein
VLVELEVEASRGLYIRRLRLNHSLEVLSPLGSLGESDPTSIPFQARERKKKVR